MGFGADLDFDLLKKVSYKTGGRAEAIYTGDDSDQQLENVYQQVGTLQRFVIKMINNKHSYSKLRLPGDSLIFSMHWNGNVILSKFSALAAPESIIWRTSGVSEMLEIQLQWNGLILSQFP